MNVRLFRLIALPSMMSGAIPAFVAGTAHAQAEAAPPATVTAEQPAAPATPAPQPAQPSPQTPAYPPQPPGYPSGYGQQGYGAYPQQQQGGYYGPMYMPPMPGAKIHDGFYLRLGFGGGVTGWQVERAGADDKVQGGMFGFNLALGGAITRNWILFGEMFSNWASEPTLRAAGVELRTDDTTFQEMGFGAGVAYYFDNNLYLSGSLRFFDLDLNNALFYYDNGAVERRHVSLTKQGPGFAFSFGKEWWAAEEWGVGVGITAFFGTAKDQEASSLEWVGGSGLLSFTATYN